MANSALGSCTASCNQSRGTYLEQRIADLSMSDDDILLNRQGFKYIDGVWTSDAVALFIKNLMDKDAVAMFLPIAKALEEKRLKEMGAEK